MEIIKRKTIGNNNNNNVGEDLEKTEPWHAVGANAHWRSIRETSMVVPQKNEK